MTSNNSRPEHAEPRSPRNELGPQGDGPPRNGRGPPRLPAGKNSRDIRHPISGVRETSEKGGNLSHPKECKGGAPSKASTIDKAAPASPNSGVQRPPRG
jgi:hypothetical protein